MVDVRERREPRPEQEAVTGALWRVRSSACVPCMCVLMCVCVCVCGV